MKGQKSDERINAVYHRLRERIDIYPHGWFVAIVEEQIVAANADFNELDALLRAQGNDPRNVLVVESGAEYPDYVTIFLV